jgi:hypothetical protein
MSSGRASNQQSQQDKAKSADEQKNISQENSVQLTHLPKEILLWEVNRFLPGKNTARLASVCRQLHSLFQPEIGEKEAQEAAEYAIYPVEKDENNIDVKNVTKLKTLLKGCPALLLHPVTIKNRHGMPIKGTVYQIALHECDNELIDDVIKPAFEKFHHGLDTMEAQRKAWLANGWMEAEKRAYASAMTVIDNVFTAFKNVSNPNDVTELQQPPYTITINNQAVNKALDAFRKAIDALYKPTDKVIESGRDPIIRLIEHKRVASLAKHFGHRAPEMCSTYTTSIMLWCALRLKSATTALRHEAFPAAPVNA